MFVAKFTQTSSAPFTADKNGNLFQREGLETNQLYLCDNSVDPEYPDNVQTTVIGKVSVMEFISLRTQLGAPSTKETVNAEPQGEIANSI